VSCNRTGRGTKHILSKIQCQLKCGTLHLLYLCHTFLSWCQFSQTKINLHSCILCQFLYEVFKQNGIVHWLKYLLSTKCYFTKHSSHFFTAAVYATYNDYFSFCIWHVTFCRFRTVSYNLCTNIKFTRFTNNNLYLCSVCWKTRNWFLNETGVYSYVL
jgi:hypothetical protein